MATTLSTNLSDAWAQYYDLSKINLAPGAVHTIGPRPNQLNVITIPATSDELDMRNNAIETLMDVGQLIGSTEKNGKRINTIILTPAQMDLLKQQITPGSSAISANSIYGKNVIIEQAEPLW